MNTVNLVVNQFNFDEEILLKAVNSKDGTYLGRTVSLCHHCHQHVPAYIYHDQRHVWMVKTCKLHGVSHHMIERDYEFYSNLKYTKNTFGFTHKNVMTEVTDKCNANCPHCYHIPDNSKPDVSYQELISKIHKWYKKGSDTNIIFAGAEPLLRKDIIELVETVNIEFPESNIASLTNGIRLSDRQLVKDLKDAGLKSVLIGLNHPSYLNTPVIRQKQLDSIINCQEEGMNMYYVGYTMSSTSELFDILDEIMSNPWYPPQFRIRYGSDIGRYPEQERLYVSDIYKLIKQWCDKNNKHFEDMEGDNNIYHTMVRVEGKPIRVIQWCDETDIHMEELRTGPYCDFVGDGLTNFLHQVIRRDVEKNKGIILPDSPPTRYLMENQFDYSELDFNTLR